jgi:hypothetical protein
MVANILLGLLLFFCLLLLGPGVAVQATVLNTGFVEKHLNQLDVDLLVTEEVLPQIDRIPGFSRFDFLSGSIESALLKHQDEIKTRIIGVVTDTHRYLARGGEFDLESSVKSRLLDPELGKIILADVNLSEMARELLREMVPPALSSFNITPYLEAAVPPMESWLKEKLTALLPGVYDYLFSGGAAPGVVSIPVTDIIERIRLALREAFIKSPPLEAIGIPASALGTTFDTGWEAVRRLLPVAMEIDLTHNLGNPPELTKPFAEAGAALRQARPWVQAYQNGFWLLAGITLLTLVIIVVINLNLVLIAFTTGAAFALSGLLSLPGGLLGLSAARQAVMASPDLPGAVVPWLAQLVTGVFQPLIVFAAVCLAAGAILLAVGIIFRGKTPGNHMLKVETGNPAQTLV